MTRRLLAVNAGSTSVKTSLLRRGSTGWESEEVFETLAAGLSAASAQEVTGVAHRVVHGGERRAPVVVDDGVLAELRALSDLVPLHQPPALAAIAEARSALPQATHVACFDTAFHATIPAAAATYALPARLRARVRVVGFHGLSHAWAAARAGAAVPTARRILVAHLGGGASLCAVLDGRSVATTMGFTPLDGLVMATRCGSLDPGALLWLAGHTDEDLAGVLERESGLLGLCGTADMREVVERAGAGDDAAGLALEVYEHRLVTSAGAMVAALGGLDVLVFTGGVGEHAAEVRRRVGGRLGWLGVQLRPGEPDEGGWISAATSTPVLVVHAREDLQMAEEATPLLGAVPA